MFAEADDIDGTDFAAEDFDDALLIDQLFVGRVAAGDENWAARAIGHGVGDGAG